MITLTLASTNAPLREQIKRLNDCVRRLRRRKAWKQRVRGGVQVIEVTYNATRDQWHPHMHILADVDYWPHRQLSREWLAVTEDSRICDIRRVHSQRSAAKYVSKYVVKGSDTSKLPARRLAEWAHAWHGLRVAQPFGSLHGERTREQQDRNDPPTRHLVYLDELTMEAQRGDPIAPRLLRIYHRIRQAPRPDEPHDHPPPAHKAFCRMLQIWRRVQTWGSLRPAIGNMKQHTQNALFERS